MVNDPSVSFTVTLLCTYVYTLCYYIYRHFVANTAVT